MQKTLIGTDPHTKDEVWAEVTRVAYPKAHLGYRLTYRGQRTNLVLDTEGRWIDERAATRENSTWRTLKDAEIAAVHALHR